MKSTLLSLLFFFISTTYIIAQNNPPYKLYKMESLYLKGNKYIKNDVAYPIGFFGSNLSQEMKISEHAINEWNSYVTNRNVSLVTSIASLGMLVGSFSTRNTNLQGGLLLGGLTLSIVSIPFSIKAGNQLQKAVWTRNRDLFQ